MESMARGFESKDVEFQQAEAERAKTLGSALTHAERDRQARRRTIELALAQSRADLGRARTVPHKKMLAAAIAALERQLAAVVAVVLLAIVIASSACGSRGEERDDPKAAAPQ